MDGKDQITDADVTLAKDGYGPLRPDAPQDQQFHLTVEIPPHVAKAMAAQYQRGLD